MKLTNTVLPCFTFMIGPGTIEAEHNNIIAVDILENFACAKMKGASIVNLNDLSSR